MRKFMWKLSWCSVDYLIMRIKDIFFIVALNFGIYKKNNTRNFSSIVIEINFISPCFFLFDDDKSFKLE